MTTCLLMIVANAVINVNFFSKKRLYSKPCLLKMGALVTSIDIYRYYTQKGLEFQD